MTELRTDYDAATTERRRAEIETEILVEIRRSTPELLGSHVPRAAIADVLGVREGPVEERRYLVLRGELAEPLWSLIDEGDMTLHTAVELLRRAKSIKVHPETTHSALKRAIAEYYALPYARSLANGKVTRHGTPERRGRPQVTENKKVPRKPPERPPTAPASVETHVRELPEPTASGSNVDFWRQMRATCTDYARSRLPEVEYEQIEPHLRGLEADLKTAFEQFYEAVRRVGRTPSLRVEITRRQFTDACRALTLDPPRDIQRIPPQFFETARRQFKRLAREYHPDTSSGGEATRSRYEAVVAAWRTLQQFKDDTGSQRA
jgi:hypothetical protein